ncbi:DUF2237 family protein [Moritella sp. 28]|uniref:DUF2237 family protein n=1 Tax=Moritella sp. 28 TaxID=2746232 RepID=UPI001BA48086|nr:DUF2237 family protein [Moritella sp. 28]QUM86214.1 DUF2237 family protein [Moritella sp. 28]
MRVNALKDHYTVCIEASAKFLEYSRFKGNDLSTPVPDSDFKGLRAGDRWCLCAARWLQALEDNMALLKPYAMDLS